MGDTLSSQYHALTLDRLLDECDIDARNRSRTLEHAGLLPHGFTAATYPLTTTEHREGRRLYAALMCADTWDVFVALVRGRPVPAGRIRPEYQVRP